MILFLCSVGLAYSIHLIFEIRKSNKQLREYPPGWEEELKRKYFEKHPDEKPNWTMEPLLVLSIIYGLGAIYGVYEIYRSDKEFKELHKDEFPPGWEEELKRKYLAKHPEEQPNWTMDTLLLLSMILIFGSIYGIYEIYIGYKELKKD